MTGYLGRIEKWSKEHRKELIFLSLFLVFIFAIFGLFYFAYFSDKVFLSETSIRYFGLILQIIGFGTIAYRLHQLQRSFSNSFSLWRAFKNFPLPWQKKSASFYPGTGSINFASGGRVSALALTAGNTLEERVINIERKLDNVQQELKDIQELSSEMNSELKRVRGELQTLDKRIDIVDENMRKFVQSIMVNGIHWEWLGVCFFVVGVTLSTVSQEVFNFLNR